MRCIKKPFLALITSVFLASCIDSEERGSERKSGNIYTSYSIWGEEGKEFVTVFFQFHAGGSDAPGIVLKEPAKVLLDDVLLSPDSALESGGFYELQIPVDDFVGEHTIRFVDTDEKEYREEFSFKPFTVLNDLGNTVKRGELVLSVKGLQEDEIVRIVMMDTAFHGEGVNELDTVSNNRLDLRKFLPALKNGPVLLHLYKEEDRMLYKKPPGGGRISITYGLKREFELKD